MSSLVDRWKRIRGVRDAMLSSNLIELDVRIGSDRVAIRCPEMRDPKSESLVPALDNPAPVQKVPRGTAVKSPLAGTYYASLSPGADPFVRVGARVSEGDVIGLVEAMKVFNEVTSDQTGEVVAVLVESGDILSNGQAIIIVDTGKAQGGIPDASDIEGRLGG